MIQSFLKSFVLPKLDQMSEGEPQMAVELATAVLMIEVSRADFNESRSEQAAIRQLLLKHLSLNPQAIDELLDNAQQEADDLVSLQHLTRLLNEKLDQAGKARVIELMWLVAYADGEKHHYEEHLLRKVSDLLYVSHEDYTRARHQAEQGADVG